MLLPAVYTICCMLSCLCPVIVFTPEPPPMPSWWEGLHLSLEHTSGVLLLHTGKPCTCTNLISMEVVWPVWDESVLYDSSRWLPEQIHQCWFDILLNHFKKFFNWNVSYKECFNCTCPQASAKSMVYQVQVFLWGKFMCYSNVSKTVVTSSQVLELCALHLMLHVSTWGFNCWNWFLSSATVAGGKADQWQGFSSATTVLATFNQVLS